MYHACEPSALKCSSRLNRRSKDAQSERHVNRLSAQGFGMGVCAYTPMCARALVCRWVSARQEGVRGPGALCSCHGLRDQKRRITECQALYLKCFTGRLHAFCVKEKKSELRLKRVSYVRQQSKGKGL